MDEGKTLVKFNGHLIDPNLIDRFIDGETGLPISDEEWDEQERRIAVHGGESCA